MNTTTIISILVAAVVLGSCAETAVRWQHPTLPEAAWAAEETDCRRRASGSAERAYRWRTDSRPSAETRSSAIGGKMDRFEAQRWQADLFDRCMAGKGFVQASAQP